MVNVLFPEESVSTILKATATTDFSSNMIILNDISYATSVPQNEMQIMTFEVAVASKIYILKANSKLRFNNSTVKSAATT